MTESSKDPWHVYIVECSDNTYYTGITNHIKKRIKAHNAGLGAKYTRGRTPVKLLYSEKHIGKSEASKREAEIKSLTRKQKASLV